MPTTALFQTWAPFLFIFLAAGGVAFFAFLSITHWTNTRARERLTVERYALLRQVAERPAESARLVVELLREEDARLEAKARQRAARRHMENLKAGLILIAAGVGLAIMLISMADSEDANVWTVGLIPGLIGAVILVFETLACRGRSRQADSRS